MSKEVEGADPVKTTVSTEAFRELAASLGFPIQPQDEKDYLQLLRGVVSAVDTVQAMPSYHHPLIADDSTGRTYTAPEPSENPLNAWSHRTVIRPTGEGLLTGKTVAYKDNVSVAGLPMTVGTQPFHLSRDKPYPISTFDAPVVSRVLEAGGTILGTSTCENYCMSALSFTSATGPVENPWVKGHETGGSSSGSAALVAIKSVRERRRKNSESVEVDDLGEGVDLAVGGDQGGSIRLPAAYSGIYGLKPTHGLVPYTGLVPLHSILDHCGPMAGSVRYTALFLTVLAGWDGLDPRMTPETPQRGAVPRYHELLDEAVDARRAAGHWTPTTAARGLRVGLVREAWDAPQLDPGVASAVRLAGRRFAALGGTVDEDVSVPLHAMAATIFAAACRADMPDVFLDGRPADGLSWPLPGTDPPPYPRDGGWYEAVNGAAPTVVDNLLCGEFMRRDRGRFPLAARGKAVTHVHELRAAYDAVLLGEGGYDVLITPANPTVGMRHPSPGLSVMEKSRLALGNTWNTCAFNLTGHPGLVIPIGWGRVSTGGGGGDGGGLGEGEGQGERLPIGMQMIGRRWGEADLFLAAAAWEIGGLGLDAQ